MFFFFFQFVYYIGYRGIIVGFDEVEQSFNVDRKKFVKIFLILCFLMDVVVNLKDVFVLIVYVMINDVYEEMNKYLVL